VRAYSTVPEKAPWSMETEKVPATEPPMAGAWA
jgi:hypothetical protein